MHIFLVGTDIICIPWIEFDLCSAEDYDSKQSIISIFKSLITFLTTETNKDHVPVWILQKNFSTDLSRLKKNPEKSIKLVGETASYPSSSYSDPASATRIRTKFSVMAEF